MTVDTRSRSAPHPISISRRVARQLAGAACAAGILVAGPAVGQSQQQPTQQPAAQQEPSQQQPAQPGAKPQGGAQAGAQPMAGQGGGAQGAGQQPGAQQRGGPGAPPQDVTVIMIEEAAKQPPVSISAGDLAAEPSRYYGRNVEIRAEVEEVFGPRVFTLDEDRAFAGPDVLVLAPTPHSTPTDGREVTVTGVVRPYVRAQLERDYDWFDLSEQLEVTFRSRPVLVANTIAPAGEATTGEAATGEAADLDER